MRGTKKNQRDKRQKTRTAVQPPARWGWVTVARWLPLPKPDRSDTSCPMWQKSCRAIGITGIPSKALGL